MRQTIKLMEFVKTILTHLEKNDSFEYNESKGDHDYETNGFDLDNEQDYHTLTTLMQHAGYVVKPLIHKGEDSWEGYTFYGFTVMKGK